MCVCVLEVATDATLLYDSEQTRQNCFPECSFSTLPLQPRILELGIFGWYIRHK